MKLQIRQPGSNSLEVVTQAIAEQQTIFRSPHVGNLNSNELRLLFGLDQLGANTQVLLVDTVRGDDRYSNPRSLIVGQTVLSLASRNYAKSRVVGACEVQADTVQLENIIGYALDTSETLTSLHMRSLQKVMPASINITLSSEFFSGRAATYQQVMTASEGYIDRSFRLVDEQGKIREVHDTQGLTLFGMGDKPTEGVMPPLEAVLAFECVNAIAKSPGQDVQIVHVGGPDMVQYVGDETIMGPVGLIAKRAIGRLGLPQNVTVEYTVPSMSQLLADTRFPQILEPSINSQYDILRSNEVYV